MSFTFYISFRLATRHFPLELFSLEKFSNRSRSGHRALFWENRLFFVSLYHIKLWIIRELFLLIRFVKHMFFVVFFKLIVRFVLSIDRTCVSGCINCVYFFLVFNVVIRSYKWEIIHFGLEIRWILKIFFFNGTFILGS